MAAWCFPSVCYEAETFKGGIHGLFGLLRALAGVRSLSGICTNQVHSRHSQPWPVASTATSGIHIQQHTRSTNSGSHTHTHTHTHTLQSSLHSQPPAHDATNNRTLSTAHTSSFTQAGVIATGPTVSRSVTPLRETAKGTRPTRHTPDRTTATGSTHNHIGGHSQQEI